MSTGLLLRSLRPRDPREPGRVASPLELLTDLCFVVAVSQAVLELEHYLTADDLGPGLVFFAMAFFAIWWAWLNFTWFASAYDNDDVGYRLLTILQILGSLVLAAGVAGFAEGDFHLGVTGYVIMRVALVAQWLRAARSDPDHRITCRRYAVGILAVQVYWVAFLVVPHGLHVPLFVVGALLEFCVPVFAERAGHTTWHPHHVAERYGLFFIIVLGETILSTTVAIKGALGGHVVAGLALVVVGGVLLVFSLWWIYFTREAAEVLERAHDEGLQISFVWGFGHYLILACGAAIGAGLAARVAFWTEHEPEHPVPALASGAMVTLPAAVLLATLWLVQLRRQDRSVRTWGPFGAAILLLVLATFTPVPELLAGVICAALVAVEVRVAGLVSSSAPD